MNLPLPRLSELEFLVRAGRSASLSEAARACGMSAAAASALVKRLEAQLGVRLFVRSTRSLRLSTEGEAFLAQCEQGLALIQHACEGLSAGRAVIRGLVRLSLPSDLGRNLVLPWLHDFQQHYPEVELRLQFSDRLAGLYREPVDGVLRYGHPADSSLVALPVAPHNRRVLCASPAYVAAHGAPQHPLDLRQHRCVCLMLSDRLHDRWHFTRGEEALTVPVSGPIHCDDGEAAHRLACLGAGIVYKSRLDVAEDLQRGTLLPLCEDWQTEGAPLYLACADRSQLRPAVRLLREWLMKRMGEISLSGVAHPPNGLQFARPIRPSMSPP